MLFGITTMLFDERCLAAPPPVLSLSEIQPQTGGGRRGEWGQDCPGKLGIATAMVCCLARVQDGSRVK